MARWGTDPCAGSSTTSEKRSARTSDTRAPVSIAIEYSTSKAAIGRAAKQLADKRGAGKLATAVIEKIRELGGATNAPDSMPLGEYTRGRDEPAEKPAIDMGAVNALLEAAG